LPMIGIVAIFLYQRRRRQQALAVQAAQPILASNVPFGQPGNPRQSTNTSWNMSPMRNPGLPPRQYTPFSYPGPEQVPAGPQANAPFFLPQTPLPPPNTPAASWKADFPAISTEEGENKEAPRFGPLQENVNQQAGGKAPQE